MGYYYDYCEFFINYRKEKHMSIKKIDQYNVINKLYRIVKDVLILEDLLARALQIPKPRVVCCCTCTRLLNL